MAPMLSTFGGGSIRGFNGGGSAGGGISDLNGIFKDNIKSAGEVVMRFEWNDNYSINPGDINSDNWNSGSFTGNRSCFVAYIATITDASRTGYQTSFPTNQTLNFNSSSGTQGYTPSDSVVKDTPIDNKGAWFGTNDSGWLEVRKAASDLVGQKAFIIHGFGEATGTGGAYHHVGVFKMYSSALSADVYFAPKGSIQNNAAGQGWGLYVYYPTVYSSFSAVKSAAINNGSPYVLGASDFMY